MTLNKKAKKKKNSTISKDTSIPKEKWHFTYARKYPCKVYGHILAENVCILCTQYIGSMLFSAYCVLFIFITTTKKRK